MCGRRTRADHPRGVGRSIEAPDWPDATIGSTIPSAAFCCSAPRHSHQVGQEQADEWAVGRSDHKLQRPGCGNLNAHHASAFGVRPDLMAQLHGPNAPTPLLPGDLGTDTHGNDDPGRDDHHSSTSRLHLWSAEPNRSQQMRCPLPPPSRLSQQQPDSLCRRGAEDRVRDHATASWHTLSRRQTPERVSSPTPSPRPTRSPGNSS
jgi:hypothetical protein